MTTPNQPAPPIRLVAHKDLATHSLDVLNPRLRGPRKWEPTHFFVAVNATPEQVQGFAITSKLTTKRAFDRAHVRIAPIRGTSNGTR